MALITDKFGKASIDTNYAIADTVKTTRTSGTTVLEANDLSRFNANTPVFFVTYKKTTDPVTAITSVTNLVSWKALVNTGANTLTNLTLAPGYVDTGNDVGDFIECIPTSFWENSLVDGIQESINPDGSLKNQAVKDALGITTDPTGGWQTQAYTPSTITNNGNHSQDLTFTGVDLAPTLSEGMRVRLTRTVPTQVQVTSLNGTTQYWNNTSPAGMTFTDDFVVTAKVKLSSYSAAGTIVSRYNGTSGWAMDIASGVVRLGGLNAGAGNASYVQSTQSIPLNKWVTVTAQLDMSGYSASPTVSYIMIDGVDVPATVSRFGSNPTSLIQAGNLEVGSSNATNLFPGKIAQGAIFNAKVTQATMRSYEKQSFLGTEPNLISAFKFDGNGNSIGTSNNLTAQGSVTATEPDSPFGNSGASSTKDYAIVMSKPVYSGGNTTMTVQTPEGSSIPTSGGVSSVDYSSASVPFGFPRAKSKWTLLNYYNSGSKSAPTPGTWYNVLAANSSTSPGDFILPIGSWKVGYQITLGMSRPAASSAYTYASLATTYNGSPGSAEMARRFEVVTRSTAVGASSNEYEAPVTKEDNMTVSVATPLHMIVTNDTGGNNLYISGYPKIYAENAYL